MTRVEESVRATIVRSARRLREADLGVGTSGNLSTRAGSGLLITPTALPYDRLGEEDIVELSLAGEVLAGSRRPSTEWPFHTAIYRARPEVGAVVHAHSPYATALSCVRAGIPAFHYMVAIAGGNSIRCAGYAMPGSRELALEALEALTDRDACLLANHGLISLGRSIDEAFELAFEVENLARQYWLACQIGEPVLLSGPEMAVVLEHLASYRTAKT